MTLYDACIRTVYIGEDYTTSIYIAREEAVNIVEGRSTKPSLYVKGNHYRLFNRRRGGCSFKTRGEFYLALYAVVSKASILPKNGQNKFTKDDLPEGLVELVKKGNLEIYSLGPEHYTDGKLNKTLIEL